MKIRSKIINAKTKKAGLEVRGKFKREGTYVYLWLIHVDV